jgi:hypothetical protein
MSKHTPSASASAAVPEVQALLPIYQEWLPLQVIRQLFEDTGHRFYQRVLPPLVMLWGFIFQRLNPDHSCDAAWSNLSSDAVRESFGLAPLVPKQHSESNSAYCQARQRLPWAVAQRILPLTARACHKTFGAQGLWHGYRVNLVDGSTLRLSARSELTEHYGTPSNQHGRSRWPLLRLVAGFDLFSGVANAVAEGPYRTSEQTLAAEVIRGLGAGVLHLGDGNFGVYHLLQVITAVQGDALFRLSRVRAQHLASQALRSGMELDVVWGPSRFDTYEEDLPTPAIGGRLIYVRMERDGFRPLELYLFTTLLDRAEFPLPELVKLYGERWNVELDLRHVKTTLQMEELDGQSVDIVRKELVLGLTAYNLLRGLMGVAAIQAQRLPLELSLAQCWRRTLDAMRSLPLVASPVEVERVAERLLIRLGRCVLPKRKRERFEPRAVWGHRNVYPKIRGSREETRQAWMGLLRNKKS